MVMTVIVVPLGTEVEIFIISQYHSSFAGGKGFIIVKTEDTHITERAQLFPVIASTGSLRIVFEDEEFIFSRYRHDLVDMRRRTAHVYRNDSLRVGRYPLFYIAGIHVQGLIDVRRDGNRSDFQHRLIRCNERKGRHDYLIPRSHIHSRKGHPECRGPGCNTKGELCLTVACEGLFKFTYLKDPFSLLVKTVSHKNARFHDIHDFFHLFFSNQFRTCHITTSSRYVPSK